MAIGGDVVINSGMTKPEILIEIAAVMETEKGKLKEALNEYSGEDPKELGLLTGIVDGYEKAIEKVNSFIGQV